MLHMSSDDDFIFLSRGTKYLQLSLSKICLLLCFAFTYEKGVHLFLILVELISIVELIRIVLSSSVSDRDIILAYSSMHNSLVL